MPRSTSPATASPASGASVASKQQPAAKRCHVCRLSKPLSLFYRDKSRGDGRSSRCIACDKLVRPRKGPTALERRVQLLEALVAKLTNDGTKACTKCGNTLPLAEFHRRGLRFASWCKGCTNGAHEYARKGYARGSRNGNSKFRRAQTHD